MRRDATVPSRRAVESGCRGRVHFSFFELANEMLFSQGCGASHLFPFSTIDDNLGTFGSNISVIFSSRLRMVFGIDFIGVYVPVCSMMCSGVSIHQISR